MIDSSATCSSPGSDECTVAFYSCFLMQIIHLIHYAMIHNTDYTELHCHCSWHFCGTHWIKETESQLKRFGTSWPNDQEFFPFPSPPFPSTIQFIPFHSLSKYSVAWKQSRVGDRTTIQEAHWPRYQSHFICFKLKDLSIDGKMAVVFCDPCLTKRELKTSKDNRVIHRLKCNKLVGQFCSYLR